jgi:hypothetical protein
MIFNTEIIFLELQSRGEDNVVCIAYSSFNGQSTELIHDPTVGISAASSIAINFMIFSFLLLDYVLIVNVTLYFQVINYLNKLYIM